MSGKIRFEIQNRTRFPLTWLDLRREGAATAPHNLLREAVGPQRGLVLDVTEPGRVRLVCGWRGVEAGAESDPFDLEAGVPLSVRVTFDPAKGFGFEATDARARATGSAGGAQDGTGGKDRFAWSPVPGRHSKA